MYAFSVNGNPIEYHGRDKKLLAFLREDLNLTGTKDGCSEGACGTCMVIIDERKVKACAVRLSKLSGTRVTTIEGLGERERQVYAHAFAEAGAVQCGFCTPGMIISAKALLDRQPDPSKEEVREAIKGNICRCTGYKKIEEAILLAARMLREHLPIPENNNALVVGSAYRRIDAAEKALGTGLYTDDIRIEGMRYAKAVRSAYPRARVLSIDATEAAEHPDFLRIIDARDVPCNTIGHLVQDWPVFIPVGEISRYTGDALCLVVGRRAETLDEIASLVSVTYEPLKPVLTIAEALEEGAPKIHPTGNILSHQHIRRGDVDAALTGSAHVITRHFSTPFTEHAFMEVECAVAVNDGDGVLVYTSSQSIYDEQREISMMLALPPHQVRCRSMLVGGGFGGKEDMSVQHHAALAAYLIGEPVKVKLSRKESIMVHPKRHPMEIELTVGCDREGRLTAMRARIHSNTGAYASLGGPVLQRACIHASGPYRIPAFESEGWAVYTNTVPAGAFRGFGVTQSCFAIETVMNLLADRVGIDHWQIRRLNALQGGDTIPNGQIAASDTGIIECLEAVKEAFYSSPTAGIAAAFKNTGLGVGYPDTGRCILSVEGGRVHIRTSAACMGQGVATVCMQMVGETCALTAEEIVVEAPDTLRTPDSGTSTASRQTLFTGEAVRQASLKLKAALAHQSLAELEGMEYTGEYIGATDPFGSDKEHPVSHVAYSYSAQVAILSDNLRVAKLAAACDVGQVVNRQSLTGQVEGGVTMGMGYALTEDFPIGEDGNPAVTFATLGLLKATEVPDITVMTVQGPECHPMAYGAKGVGELTTLATAPAIAAAYYRTDRVERTSLPLEGTPYQRKQKKR
jgi:selenium-dependent xanthine dehydrogenase